MHKLRKQNLKLNKNVDFRIVNIGDNISTSMCCVTQTIHIKFMVILKWFECRVIPFCSYTMYARI